MSSTTNENDEKENHSPPPNNTASSNKVVTDTTRRSLRDRRVSPSSPPLLTIPKEVPTSSHLPSVLTSQTQSSSVALSLLMNSMLSLSIRDKGPSTTDAHDDDVTDATPIERDEPVAIFFSFWEHYQLYYPLRNSTENIHVDVSDWVMLELTSVGWSVMARGLLDENEAVLPIAEVMYVEVRTGQRIELPNVQIELQRWSTRASFSTSPLDTDNITTILVLFDPSRIIIYNHKPYTEFWVGRTLDLDLGIAPIMYNFGEVIARQDDFGEFNNNIRTSVRIDDALFWISNNSIHVVFNCSMRQEPFLSSFELFDPVNNRADIWWGLVSNSDGTSLFLIGVFDGMVSIYEVQFLPTFDLIPVHNTHYTFFLSASGYGWARSLTSYPGGKIYLSGWVEDVVTFTGTFVDEFFDYEVVRWCEEVPEGEICPCESGWFLQPQELSCTRSN